MHTNTGNGTANLIFLWVVFSLSLLSSCTSSESTGRSKCELIIAPDSRLVPVIDLDILSRCPEGERLEELFGTGDSILISLETIAVSGGHETEVKASGIGGGITIMLLLDQIIDDRSNLDINGGEVQAGVQALTIHKTAKPETKSSEGIERINWKLVCALAVKEPILTICYREGTGVLQVKDASRTPFCEEMVRFHHLLIVRSEDKVQVFRSLETI